MGKINFVEEIEKIIGDDKRLSFSQKRRIVELQKQFEKGNIELEVTKEALARELRSHRVYSDNRLFKELLRKLR